MLFLFYYDGHIFIGVKNSLQTGKMEIKVKEKLGRTKIGKKGFFGFKEIQKKAIRKRKIGEKTGISGKLKTPGIK